ncbi:MAG: carboxypeptidase regulatory-like domain-containing protein, partial [Planctomycetaceae bacterium]|nr:carboxypeptidase regulatory-like domain-containing protein [Planctomycetaceae bacterium]
PSEEEYETDEDGYYRCLVDHWTWSYMIYQPAAGYSGIVPINGRHEVEIPTPAGGKVEYTFRCVRQKAKPQAATTRDWRIQVVDDDGQPVPSPRVKVISWLQTSPTGKDPVSIAFTGVEESRTRIHKGNADGWLELTLPVDATATLQIDDPRFFGSVLEGLKTEVNESGDAQPAVLKPSVDANRTLPVLRCWRGDRFVGRVLQADGRPAADSRLNVGARVSATQWMDRLGIDHRIQMSWDHGQWPNWYTAVITDADGRFSVQVPPATAVNYVRVGSATLSFGAINDDAVRAANPDSAMLRHVPFMVELKREQAQNGVFDAGEISLESGVALNGRVIRADGSPAVGVQLWAEPVVEIRRDAYEFSPHAGRYVVTDDHGLFELAPLRPGKVTFTIRDHPRDGRG